MYEITKKGLKNHKDLIVKCIDENNFEDFGRLSSSLPTGIMEDLTHFLYHQGVSYEEMLQGITKIGDGSLAGVLAKDLHIPEGVEYIDDKAFWFSTDLENIYLPKSLNGVGYYNSPDELFSGCNLGKLTVWVHPGTYSEELAQHFTEVNYDYYD